MQKVSPNRPVILITGASGQLGHAVAEQLRGAYTIVGLDQTLPDIRHLDGAYRCDLTDPTALRVSLSVIAQQHGGHLRSVIHLAETDALSDPDALQRDVEATADLTEALSLFDTVEQLIIPSTAAVLAAPKEGQIQTPYQDIDAQGIWARAKLLQEAIGAERFGGQTVILRLGHLYTSDSIDDMASRLAQRLAGFDVETMLFGGVPLQAQPVLHRDDAARCIKMCVDQRRRLLEREVFLVAEPRPVAFRAVLSRLMERSVGVSLPKKSPLGDLLDRGRALLGADKPRELTADDEIIDFELRARLGWKPEHMLRANLDTLIEDAGAKTTAQLREALNG